MSRRGRRPRPARRGRGPARRDPGRRPRAVGPGRGADRSPHGGERERVTARCGAARRRQASREANRPARLGAAASGAISIGRPDRDLPGLQPATVLGVRGRRGGFRLRGRRRWWRRRRRAAVHGPRPDPARVPRWRAGRRWRACAPPVRRSRVAPAQLLAHPGPTSPRRCSTKRSCSCGRVGRAHGVDEQAVEVGRAATRAPARRRGRGALAELVVAVGLEVLVGQSAVGGELLPVGEVLAVADLEVAPGVEIELRSPAGRRGRTCTT